MDECEARQYCTFAVTGPHKAKQAVYVCRSCAAASRTRRKAVDAAERNVVAADHSDDRPIPGDNHADEGDAPLCVCQACAELCHGDHEGLEYVGFGPSYCDCRDHGSTACQLVQASDEAAMRLNLTSPACSEVQDDGAAAKGPASSYRMEAFAIEELVDDERVCRQLHQSACALVRLSKETFWLDPATTVDDDDDVPSLCDLEELALAVYRHHAASSATQQNVCGAEWWIQVKPAHDPEAGAVDLHYDKDEAVAEAFGLGYFPYLSTVTYLSGCRVESEDGPAGRDRPEISLAPTIVLSRVHGDNHNDGSDVEVLLSHPRRGKHLAFDGRLLHGAPAAWELRESPPMTTTTTTTVAPSMSEPGRPTAVEAPPQLRVTFLVNLWSNHKPANVSELPSDLRAALLASRPSTLPGPSNSNRRGRLSFRRLAVPQRRVSSATDLGSEEPLHLPFVSRNATWAVPEDVDDEEEELVLSMLVPRDVRHPNLHTVLFRFDADHSPFLTSAVADGGDDDDDDDNEGDGSRSYS